MKWRDVSEHWEGAEHPPRRWQAACLPIAIAELGAKRPVVVQAVMGSGKTFLIAELVRSAVLEEGEHVIITTPTQRLVEQLAAALAARLGLANVGRYYGRAKNIHAPVIVVCSPSAPRLAMELKGWGGRRCALWISDEVHRTECNQIKAAHDMLHPERSIGFTATPWRGRRTEELSLWERLIYRYGPAEAIEEGVVVPWEIVPWTGEEVTTDEACLEMLQTAEGPGVVSASSIRDAEQFARKMCDAGIPAAAIHSRLPDGRDVELMMMLERGVIRALVHVSLLQEGIDLPWLRWLCLRRPVRSSVRFTQEVGRVLRAAPGKERAVIFDPNDLFAEHRLTQDAVLQGMAEPTQSTARAVLAKASKRDALALAQRMVTGLEPAEAYLRTLVVALHECGALPERSAGGPWRREPVTERQIAAIERHAWLLRMVRGLPPGHLRMLRKVYQHRKALRKGSASDFLSIIFNLPTAGWPNQASRLGQLRA